MKDSTFSLLNFPDKPASSSNSFNLEINSFPDVEFTAFGILLEIITKVKEVKIRDKCSSANIF